MKTTIRNRALPLIVAAILTFTVQAAEVGTAIIPTGQAHIHSEDARRAMDACDLAKARRHVTTAQQYLKQIAPDAAAPAQSVRDSLSAIESELSRRETFAARAEQDLATLVRNHAWREAEIRLAAAASSGCVGHLSGYQKQVGQAAALPRGYAGPAANTGRTVKALMILGTIGGSGWIIQHRLRSRGMF